MQYKDNSTYYYPPRPENAIMKMALGAYESMGWVAQVKKNGTCNLIAVSPDKTLHCMTRHAEPHKMWTPDQASTEPFKVLKGKGWYLFVAELMHHKTPNIKNINYINDVLAVDGEHLIDTTFRERQKLIAKLFKTSKDTKETPSHYVVHPNLWIAKNYEQLSFRKLFDTLHKPEDEGLVLKDPNAKLVLGRNKSSNSGWMVKVRRATKNYGY
jgi:hypothetical protein